MVKIAVAPFVGAWIEMKGVTEYYRKEKVAPFVGAWIEMQEKQDLHWMTSVAPFVGAWIEISWEAPSRDQFQSLPSWERGLK